MRWLALLAVLALAGCGAGSKSNGTTAQAPAQSSSQAPGGTSATAASAPHEIEELSNQTLIYECPKCGMMFDAAGTCTMDGSTLVATQVAYICPADGKPVEHAGQCPRCAVNARVQKTAMAAGSGPIKQ